MRPPSAAKSAELLFAGALFLAVLACRLAFVAYAGSPLPYYDQWVAEFNNTFLQIVGGAPAWDLLFIRHNEHQLFTTKLATLVGFGLNGYWDVRFLNVAAACARALEAVLLWRILRPVAAPRWLVISAALPLFFAFTLPLSGYNVLCGLQLSFYFAEIGMLCAVYAVLHWTGPRSAFVVVASSAFALLSFGSGLAIPATILAVHVAARASRRGFWWAWAVSVAFALVYLRFGSGSTEGAYPNPATLGERLNFLFSLLSFPFRSAGAGIIVAIGLAIIWKRCPRPMPAPLAAAVGVFTFAFINACFIALKRPAAEFHMRHWETVALISGAVCVGLVNLTAQRRWLAVAVAALGLTVGLGLAQRTLSTSVPYLREASTHRDAAVQHYRQQLLSGGIIADGERLNQQLARRDYAFFDHPVGRFSIHAVVAHNIASNPKPALALLSPEILPGRSRSFVGWVVHQLIQNGWILGILALVAALVALRLTPQAPARRP